MENIKAIRGTTDILPEEVINWVEVENLARSIFAKFGYAEIRTPIMEDTALFKRSIGDTTDIVQKQMYTFQDRGERSITLRPEATAAVVRAYLEHNLGKDGKLTKLFYIGPMFRAERPQAGRQRQFHQIGVEAIGSPSPYLDAEVIKLLTNFLKQSGVDDFQVKLNSLGCIEDKKRFASELKKELKAKFNNLCEDCRSRFENNIFRVLDCKNPDCKKIVGANGYSLLLNTSAYLCKDCASHFDNVKKNLDLLGVKYTVTSGLVRGLDYYTGTVFEVVGAGHVRPLLGSQDAIAAGGRYDGLIAELGGPSTPAVGFAIGVERLLTAIGDVGAIHELPLRKIYIATLGEEARKKGFEIANDLRESGIACEMGYEEKSLKAQLRQAGAFNCSHVVIIGEDELKKGKVILRDMAKSEQSEIEIGKIIKEFIARSPEGAPKQSHL